MLRFAKWRERHRCVNIKLSNDVANKSTLKKGTLQIIRRVVPIRQDIAYSFCLTGAETEIHKIKDDGKNERETNLDRRGPSQIGARILEQASIRPWNVFT